MGKGQVFVLFLLVVVLALIGLGQPFYVINEGEQAIITQFGKPVGGAIRDAGIHLKMPFIQTVNRLEKRILEWDGKPTGRVLVWDSPKRDDEGTVMSLEDAKRYVERLEGDTEEKENGNKLG